jgi:hypothetical protein
MKFWGEKLMQLITLAKTRRFDSVHYVIFTFD